MEKVVSSHMIASVLQEAGYKVGLYTSPHLKDFRERIKINGVPCSKEFVVNFISNHKGFLEKHQLSFFEMTVGMAFDYFKSEAVDIAVIEVGLGGRLDSTNIITPEVCLITNIGFDHMQYLGDTLPKIATEKAGIIKPKVPVVISESQAETSPVFTEIAQNNNAPILYADTKSQPAYTTDLKGAYQQKNLCGVIAVLNVLKSELSLEEKHYVKGLNAVIPNTGLLGRWQVLDNAPKIICDTAHNQEGLSLVLNQLLVETYHQLHIVLGFVKDKNISQLLKLFPEEATYYFAAAKNNRAILADDLATMAKEEKLKGDSYSSVNEAFLAAKKHATKNDLIYVGGSTFVVAEMI